MFSFIKSMWDRFQDYLYTLKNAQFYRETVVLHIAESSKLQSKLWDTEAEVRRWKVVADTHFYEYIKLAEKTQDIKSQHNAFLDTKLSKLYAELEAYKKLHNELVNVIVNNEPLISACANADQQQP